jgi:hypothetical protein
MKTFPFTLRGGLRAAVVGGAASAMLAAATVAGTALAADQTTSAVPTLEALGPHTHQIHGVVKTAPASGATTFTVTTQRFGDVTVSFAGAAPRGRGHARGRARSVELAAVSDLKAGDRVLAQGRTSADGKSFVARRVHVLPGKDAASRPVHIVGTISAVARASGVTTLTVKLADGTSQTATLSSETKIRPAGESLSDLTVGTRVTVVSKNGAATGVVVLPA